jgi:RimJ/RimL family protein N-acetyltransferase
MPAEVPVIEAGEVVLRPFELRDAALVVAVASDPLIPLVTTVPATGDPDEAAAYVRRQQGRLAEGVGYSFAVADASSDEAVGQIGLWTRDLAHGRASIGYWLAAEHRGRGLAGAALRGLVGWARTLPEVHRLQLVVEPWNEASWRTAAACGFEREGLLRGYERIGDEHRDVYVYGLVADG